MGNQDVIGFYFAYDWLRERGASFLDQSQSEVKENQLTELKTNCNPGLLLERNWKLLWSNNTLNSLCYGNRDSPPIKCWLYL